MSTFNDELHKISKRGYEIRKKLIHLDPKDKATRISNTCFISAGNSLNNIIQKLPTLKVLPETEIINYKE